MDLFLNIKIRGVIKLPFFMNQIFFIAFILVVLFPLGSNPVIEQV